MKRKKIILISTMIYFSCALFAMDEKPEKKPIKRKNTSNEGITALTRRHSTDENTDKPEQIEDTIIIQIAPEDKKEKRKSSVPPLPIGFVKQPAVASLPQGVVMNNGSSSQSSQRSCIENKAELLKKTASLRVVDKKIRQRTASMSVVEETARHKSKEVIEEPRKRMSLLPKSIAQQMAGIDLSQDDEKMYTEQQVWALVGTFNPALLEFAVRHGIDDLQDLAEYAAVMEQHDIKPRALIDHVYQNHQQQGPTSWTTQGLYYVFGDPHKQHLDLLDKKFEKIKKEDPNRYRVLMFDLIKTAADEAAGQKNRSVIADAYTTLANEQNTDQVTQIRQQWIGLGFTALGLVAGWVTSGIQYFAPAPTTPGNSTGCVCNSTNSTN